MKAKPTTARGLATVQRVLDAACELFAQQGIRSTTLDQVGRLSGTGRGQLYFYFADKADLVCEVIAQQFNDLLNAQQPYLDEIATATDMRRWCTVAANQYLNVAVIRCPVGSLVYELGDADDDTRTVLAAGFERWRKALAVALKRLQNRRELAPGVDAESASAAFLATYEGAVLLSSATGTSDALHTALQALASMALKPTRRGTTASGTTTRKHITKSNK